MCGIPLHTVETYIGKLIQKGQMVAICEQVTESDKPHPAQHGRRKKQPGSQAPKPLGGGVVKREITRLVSPGTLIEDHLLQPRSNNFLASIFCPNESNTSSHIIGLTWMDLSTGSFHYTGVNSAEELQTELHRINPVEIICSYDLKAISLLSTLNSLDDAIIKAGTDIKLQQEIKKTSKKEITKTERDIACSLLPYRITPRNSDDFSEENARIHLKQNLGDVSHELSDLGYSAACAAGGLLHYVSQTQKGGIPSLSLPKHHIINDVMHIDAATFQCLDLVDSKDSSKTLL